jgi:uncharacterized membrane protein YdjX (TVP38/TMEM64 family)
MTRKNRNKVLSKLKAAVIAMLWLGLFFELLIDPSVREHLLHFLSEHPVAAPFVLVLAQVLFATFVLPCSPLSTVAGLLWGLEVGLLYSTLATLSGSIWTFVLGRHVLKGWLLGKMPYVDVLKLIDRHGWRASMMAHANPMFPGSSLGYVFGISSVSIMSYGFGAVIGTLPLQIAMVGIGDSARRMLSDEGSVWVLVLIGLTLIVLISYKWLVPMYLRKI